VKGEDTSKKVRIEYTIHINSIVSAIYKLYINFYYSIGNAFWKENNG